MNTRSILFVSLSTALMLTAILLRPAIDVGQNDGPKKNGEEATADAARPEGQTPVASLQAQEAGSDAEVATESAADDSASDATASSISGEETSVASDVIADSSADDTDESVAAEVASDEVAEKSSESESASGEDAAAVGDQSLADGRVDGDEKPGDEESGGKLTDEEIAEMASSHLPAETTEMNAMLNAFSYRSPENQGELLTIGSLDEQGTSRYLLTANTLGGTVRRIEMNSRTKRGRYRYRDAEIKYGTLGSLDLIDVEGGCRVGVVGPGTAADEATSSATSGGIQAGDVITKFGDQPVPGRFELQVMLTTTHPGDEVTVMVLRDGAPLAFTVTLMEKPVELIRPEPGVIDPTNMFTESFSLMLKKPHDDVSKLWESLSEKMETGKWEARRTNVNGNEAIEMSFSLDEATLSPLGLKGPLKVVKRFIVPKVPSEDLSKVDDRTWHWWLEIEVLNQSDADQQLGYSLVGPTGTPSETWWYANKIYGGNTFSGVAGARDVTASTPTRNYQFISGSEILSNAENVPPQPTFVISPYDTVTNSQAGAWNWVGVDSQYFNVSMINTDNQSVANNINAVTSGAKIPDNARLKRLVDCTSLLYEDFSVPAGGSVQRRFEIFTGPKDHDALTPYGLDDNRAFGWFWWCSKPLLWLLHWFYVLTFSITYAVPIILLTVLVRCIMIPFSRKAALNAQMMQALQPKMKEIADKYEDLQERGLAQRELFKKHNYNPLGGCLVMFIQLPIFLGLYRGLSADIALRDQPLIPGLKWCSDLSAPDQFMYWKDWMPAWLGSETGYLGPYLNILPVITMVLFLVQQKLFTPPAVDDQQKMMQKMMGFMMIFMGVLFFKVPSGLCLYFITSSIWGILERKLLPKPVLDTDALDLKTDVEKPVSRSQKKKLEKELAAAEERRQMMADRKKQMKNRRP